MQTPCKATCPTCQHGTISHISWSLPVSILPDHALDNISPVGGGEHKDEAAADDDDAGQFHVSENSVFLNHIKA